MTGNLSRSKNSKRGIFYHILGDYPKETSPQEMSGLFYVIDEMLGPFW